MAALHLSFNADVDEWVAGTKQRIEAVFKESVQRTVARAQAYISGELVGVVTGFLRASIRGSDQPGVPLIDNKTGLPATYDSGSIALTIMNASADKPLYVMYAANYAAAIHNGTWKMAPRPWVALTALSWQQIVDEVAAEAKARAEMK